MSGELCTHSNRVAVWQSVTGYFCASARLGYHIGACVGVEWWWLGGGGGTGR